MNKLFIAFFFSLLVTISTVLLNAQPGVSGYHLKDSVKLGGEGGWDYLNVDTATERVYISRSTRVQVVDLLKDSVIGEIPNTSGIHGIALVPELGKGYTSNGRDSSITVFDLTTLAPITTIKIDARNPDAIMYDPYSRRVFTFNGGSSNATAFDVDSNKVVGTVPLDGKPEFGVSDYNGKIYVNNEDKSLITVFDAKSLQVLHTWKLAPGEEPSGLAIDRIHHRLFSVCSNKLMVVVDADSGNVVTTLPTGDGTDGAMFDPESQLAFSSNGEGTLTVIQEEAPDKFSVIENVPTKRGARTLVLDTKTHNIYTVTAEFGPPPPATADRPRPRPTIVPGSAKLYVIGK